MNFLNKQSFWVTIATFGVGSFTTINTYQLNKYTQSANEIQQEIMILQQNMNEMHSRMDNIYDKLVTIEENQSQGGRK